jgi:hypothetical protein
MLEFEVMIQPIGSQGAPREETGNRTDVPLKELKAPTVIVALFLTGPEDRPVRLRS